MGWDINCYGMGMGQINMSPWTTLVIRIYGR